MPTNKNAQLRYQILDRCFSDLHHKYTIEDLLRLVNEKLFAINGSSVSLRQIRDDIRYMKDPDALNAPIEAVPISGRKSYYRYADPISPSSTMRSLLKRWWPCSRSSAP